MDWLVVLGLLSILKMNIYIYIDEMSDLTTNLLGTVEIVVEHPFDQVVVEHLLAVVVAYIALKK